MFMIVSVLIAVLAGYLCGGHLRNYALIRLKLAWVPLLMFALQIGLVLFPVSQNEARHWIRPWITATSYGILLVFLFANRRWPGFKFILLGAVLNFAVILANGGYMPVTHEALVRSGHLDRMVVQDDRVYVSGSKDVVLPKGETRLQPLTDVMGIPEALPLSATFSAGDVVIVLGASWFAFRTMVETTTTKSNPETFLLKTVTLKMNETE